MIRGTVVGGLWGSRRARGLDGRRLVLVSSGPGETADEIGQGRAGGGRMVVAIDTLDVEVGHEVLVAFGSGARNVLAPGPDNRAVLCDAAIALRVDGSDLGGPAISKVSVAPGSEKGGG